MRRRRPSRARRLIRPDLLVPVSLLDIKPVLEEKLTCLETPTATGTGTTETTPPSKPSFTGGAGALAVPGMAGSVVLGVFLGL